MKTIPAAILLFSLSASNCLGAPPVDGDIKTKGYLNGRAIIHFMNGGENGRYYATQFISGVLEGMSATKSGNDLLYNLYADTNRGQIIKAVIEYYINNPDKRYRPVVDVIMSGCKERSEDKDGKRY